KHGPTLMEHSPSSLIQLATKKTYFEYFCAGQNVSESAAVIPQLENERLQAILDYSIENTNGKNIPQWEKEAKMNHVTDVTTETLRIPKMAFGVIKVTGIAPTSVLEKLSKVICDAQLRKIELPSALRDIFPYFATRIPAFPEDHLVNNLNDDEMQQ